MKSDRKIPVGLWVAIGFVTVLVVPAFYLLACGPYLYLAANNVVPFSVWEPISSPYRMIAPYAVPVRDELVAGIYKLVVGIGHRLCRGEELGTPMTEAASSHRTAESRSGSPHHPSLLIRLAGVRNATVPSGNERTP